MSRIGKLPIKIPSQVEIEVIDQNIYISGPYGKLSKKFSEFITINKDASELNVKIKNNSRQAQELYGLTRTLINNMVIGVSKKFEQQLEIKGVGYRAQVQENTLILNLGYSHPINLLLPTGIEILVESNTNLTIKGIDKELVGQTAATIRSKRPPEPYKGKGILYKGETIKRKVGKSGK